MFTCGCGERFTAQVWHCVECDHHWPIERDTCWNCGEMKPKQHNQEGAKQ